MALNKTHKTWHTKQYFKFEKIWKNGEFSIEISSPIDMTLVVAKFAAKMLATATVADWLCLPWVTRNKQKKIFIKQFFPIMQNNLAGSKATVIKLFTTVTYKFS